jgi:hypothetical protein
MTKIKKKKRKGTMSGRGRMKEIFKDFNAAKTFKKNGTVIISEFHKRKRTS